MEHAAAVGVVDRVADVEEPAQQLLQGQRPRAGVAAFVLLVKLLDGRLEVVAADEPHGVERAAVVVGAQAVDRHDAGVFEPAGDLGLDDEAGAFVLVTGVRLLDPLQRHDAVKLLVAGDVDLAQGAAVVKPDDLESALGVSGGAGVVPALGVLAAVAAVVGSGDKAEVEEAGLEVEVGHDLEVISDLGDDVEHGEAALGVVAVLLEVLLDEDIERGMPPRAEGAAVEEDLAQGLGLVGDPGIECGQQRVAVDEVVLQGQQAEEQAPGRGGGLAWGRSGPIRDAESGGDGGRFVGEAPAILVGRGRLAGAEPELALDAEEFLEQQGAPRAGLLGQKVLDAGPVAAPFPVALEAIGKLVDPGPLTGLGVAHGDPLSAGGGRSALVLRCFPVAPDPLQLPLDGPDRAVELLGDLRVGVTLELPEGDLAQAGVFEHLEPQLQGFVQQGGLGGSGSVGVDLVKDRGRQVLAGAIGRFLGVLPANVPLPLEMAIGCVAGLAEGDPHQQVPQLIPVGKVEIASTLADAEALVHALEDVLLVFPAADPRREVVAGQQEQLLEIAPPDQPGRDLAHPRFVGSQVDDQSRDGTLCTHHTPERFREQPRRKLGSPDMG